MNANLAPRPIRVFAAIERSLISGLMAVISALTLIQVVSRFGFDQPLQWSEEIARYCFVWMTFMGAATLMRLREGHPAIDTIYLMLGPRTQRIVAFLNAVLVIAASLAIAFGGLRLLQWQWQQLSASLELPMAWIYLCMIVFPMVGIFWSLWCARFGFVEDET